MKKYLLGIDQSTQGTKVLVVDEKGRKVLRVDKAHRQIVDDNGWVEHDAEEIYANVLALISEVKEKLGEEAALIAGVGISNQRETVLAWDKVTGKPVYNAIVWQCARAAEICERIGAEKEMAELIRRRTGLQLSPYFSAAKLAWIMENVPAARELAAEDRLCCGTVDSWLIYKLTEGKDFKTDMSNASRTELFNITELCWDEDICRVFGIYPGSLPQVVSSDSDFGSTDFDGILSRPVPIRGALGDSQAALFGQACLAPGMAKATYGTGSSVMMNIGSKPAFSRKGLVTSLAWGRKGSPVYVLEGNINYTGASISWLCSEVELISSPAETESLAKEADKKDKTYFVPAFTGLGAPYWSAEATGLFTGITRKTGKKELVKAVLDSIAYQINDIVTLMQEESGYSLAALRVDGGPARNGYLMQFQSDILQLPVDVADVEELSAMGAAYMAGLALGIYDEEIFKERKWQHYQPLMQEEQRNVFLQGWRQAVKRTLWQE